MLVGFKSYIVEENEPVQVTHLTHVEDHPIQRGSSGFQHAYDTLMHAHRHVAEKRHNSELTTKYDGSPAIVYGHHPKTGKFFVATKSAFNKNPKINYTHADIEKNHGHAPGLVSKLKDALDNLSRVAPKKGVYQGDMMYSHGDLKHG
jgi:hypothetical protein